MNEFLFVAVLVFFMTGGTMDWLFTLLATFLCCYWCIAKSLRVYVERGMEGIPRNIPFPLWVYATFIPLAMIPAWGFTMFLEIFGVL